MSDYVFFYDTTPLHIIFVQQRIKTSLDESIIMSFDNFKWLRRNNHWWSKLGGPQDQLFSTSRQATEATTNQSIELQWYDLECQFVSHQLQSDGGN